mmetsp:Transcript_37519/g.6746  ORF Transcript_37519/g.6746 Transcript_37519/m.6746 type:complete len:210 (+) Transcript_37519:461-1090(+)
MEFKDINSLFRRNEVWMIKFYHPGCSHCKSMKEEWLKLADKLYGIIKVAAVNCSDEEELCEEYDVKSYPTILMFPDNTAKKYEVYKGKRTYEDFSNFAISQMTSFVRFVNSSNFADFYSKEPDQAKVLLFTTRKTTPPLLMALSKELKGKVVFGEVKSTDEGLTKQYGVTEFPTILGLKSEAEGKRFEGENKRHILERWIRDFMYDIRN